MGSIEDFLADKIDKTEKNKSLITIITTTDGSQYALFTNGDICLVLPDKKLKRVNDLVDKDSKLKDKILGAFDDSHNSSVVRTGEVEPRKKPLVEDIDLPEI